MVKETGRQQDWSYSGRGVSLKTGLGIDKDWVYEQGIQ